MKAHFVTFSSPGTFIAESTTKPIESWDVDAAKRMAVDIRERYGAAPYGFQFTTRSRGENDLDSTVTATSAFYWLGGNVETLEQVKARATDKDRILISNMEGNGYDRIITNNNSWRWVSAFKPTDVLLDWEQPSPAGRQT